MITLVERLRLGGPNAYEVYGEAADTIEALRAENARLHQAMHDIYEVYAGSEGFHPETCPEAYLQERIKEMAYIAGKHKRAGESDE